MITVVVPYHLQTLAKIGAEVKLEIPHRALIRALEALHPTLRGAIIDHNNGKRRPKIRFFACRQDISHDSMDSSLPEDVIKGREAFLIVGAISGG
jgi:sulfur-carrier protein